MNWKAVAPIILIAWGGALTIGFLVSDRGQEDDIDALRDAIQRIENQLGITPPPESIPTESIKVDCLGTPAVVNTRTLAVGTEVSCDESKITVASVGTGKEGRVEFILEGPHPGVLGQTFAVTDSEGFLCESGIGTQTGQPLLEGQKADFFVEFTCSHGPAQTLILNNTAFEFED
jgi:hypothetical protein